VPAFHVRRVRDGAHEPDQRDDDRGVERRPNVGRRGENDDQPDHEHAGFHPAGRSDIPGTRPSTLSVGPRYFETLSIPLVQGREFVPTDRAGTPAVAIVNQTFANTYFPSPSTSLGTALSTVEGRALGQRIEIGGESDAMIVGVVRDSRIDTIGEAPKSVVFYPYAQRPRRLTVIARTAGDPAATLPAFHAAIGELDAGASVAITTLRDAAGTELNMRRVGTQMIGSNR
jgi:hypothetical protein